MKKISQTTIQKEVSYEGTGLFSGEKVKLTLLPAKPNTGVVFIRTDLPARPRIPVAIENVVARYRRTTLAKNEVVVETVEHFLSTLSGLGIDNLEVEINGAELPAADGSAQDFVNLINQGGIGEQDSSKKIFVLKRPVNFVEGETSLVALPVTDDKLTIDYTLHYEAPLINTQHLGIKIDKTSFSKELAPARTFCLASEVERLLAQGLGKGGNYQNILVIDEDKVIDNQLRFPDEFVRHKVLDFLGDLYLANIRLIAHIIAIKAGHEQNLKFVRKLFEVIQESQLGVVPKARTWLDVRELQNVLPHRYPFLMIDKVIELDGYKKAVGIKNVTINEPFFQGHFPGQPIMPGVLQIEAMAQLAGALLLRRAGNENKLAVLLSIDKVKLRKSVVPGDQLRIEAKVVRIKTRTAEIYAKTLVEGELASEASIKFMLVDAE